MNNIPSKRRTPLYKQIRDYVLQQIRLHAWQPDQQIPSENELAQQFQVSRVTIRGAMNELVEEGIIYRIQGKGSFIRPDADTENRHLLETQADGDRSLIAFLMPRLNNRFTANVLSGIESEVSKSGYGLLFCKTHDSKETEKQKLSEMVSLGVKGIIVYPVADESYNEEILKLSLHHFPLVVVDRYLRGVDTNCVVTDNINGAREAAAHLIGLGHRNIAFVSSFDRVTTSLEDRLLGYQKALADHGIPVDHRLQMHVNVIDGEPDPGDMLRLMDNVSKNPDITAFFAVNASIGLMLMDVLKKMGKTVPDDVSVLFFDDLEGSEHFKVPPTCIVQQDFLLGAEAAKLLLSNIAEPNRERNKITIPTRLIERNSTVKRRS